MTDQPARFPLAKVWTVIWIVFGNLLPVFGVLFLDWDPGLILILYWIENFFVGLFTVPRILMAQGPPPTAGSVIGGTPLIARLGTAAFFTFHYGVFWIVHGFFALLLASEISPGESSPEEMRGFGLAIIGILVIQAIQFWQAWLRPRAWETANPKMEMFLPYPRLLVLHITVLLGAAGLNAIGAPTWTMLLLCIGKMAIELTGTLGKNWLAKARID